jgi:cold shock CspA family protein
MKLPLQITFRNVPASAATEKWIQDQASKLGNLYGRVMACRVMIETPHAHHRKGTPYHVRINLTVPGGDLVVKHEPTISKRLKQSGETQLRKRLDISTPHKDLRLAIHNAFQKAGRQLADYARRQSGRIKAHEAPLEARVTRLAPEKGYGFLLTSDGREVYFHKNSVLNRGFRKMRIGTRVVFSEEHGDKGPQASTVRITSALAARRTA